MKNKFNNSLWLLLFSWMLLSGAVHATCPDQGYSLCCQTSLLSPTAQTLTSPCTYPSFQWATGSFDADKNDYCCKKKGRGSQGVHFLNTQNSNCQNHSLGLAYTGQSPGNKYPIVGSILDLHKSIQTIPIYTLIQSFLC